MTDGIDDRISFLKPEHFYKFAHQQIYQAIINLNSPKPDILTVTQKLRDSGTLEEVGGPYYVTQLTNRIASNANIEKHARIIVQQYMLRSGIRIAGEMLADGYEPGTDPFDYLSATVQNIEKLISDTVDTPAKTIHKTFHESIERDTIIAEQNTQGKTSGITTGFHALDRITGGWQNSDLVILAARPGMGKTSLMAAFLSNAAKNGKGVGLFSLEMSDYQITQRLKSSETGIELSKMLRGGTTPQERALLATCGIDEWSVVIDDKSGLTVNEFKHRSRKMVKKQGVELIIVDYLQLMHGTKENREQEVNEISTALKETAKSLDIPVIALSQLSRAVDKSEDKIPHLHHLRESGSIEQNADMVGFLWRPDYYMKPEDEGYEENQGKAMIFIEKHRNGPLAVGDYGVQIKWDAQYTRFSDYEAEIYNPDRFTEPLNREDTPF